MGRFWDLGRLVDPRPVAFLAKAADDGPRHPVLVGLVQLLQMFQYSLQNCSIGVPLL